MAAADVSKETVVTEGHAASIPAVIRRKFGIQPGDVLVWRSSGKEIAVKVRRRRRRGRPFTDLPPIDFGFDTKGAADHDEVF